MNVYLTLGQVASGASQPKWRTRHILKARSIRPAALTGPESRPTPLWETSAVEAVRKAAEALDAAREARQAALVGSGG